MSKKSKSETGPSKFSQPYISSAANTVQNTFNANQGAISDIASTIQGGIPGLADKAFGDNPLVAAAKSYNQDVLSGKYLSGNPLLEEMISKTAGDVTNRVNGAIGMRGRTGGDAHSSILGRELASAENSLRYSDYDAERARMAGASSAVPGLESAEYAGIAPLLAAAQAGAEIPFTGSNNLASAIAALMGNSTSTTSKQGLGAALMQAAGAAAGAYAASDPRLKVDVEKVGEMDDGLGVYDWTYVWGGPRQRGVMADEVKRLRPWALGPVIGGYSTVNYGAL
ncbi:MAG: hypothetical protein ABS87_01025 [Sphingomonas sp. SCN 67-18]|nr:hypothetical protein [Sphingomonas sp. SCN 67-18]ODU22781.1 MAG: hypothetical protein ABS87_01025 [Sphingomonas sp. SCN 67-18]